MLLNKKEIIARTEKLEINGDAVRKLTLVETIDLLKELLLLQKSSYCLGDESTLMVCVNAGTSELLKQIGRSVAGNFGSNGSKEVHTAIIELNAKLKLELEKVELKKKTT